MRIPLHWWIRSVSTALKWLNKLKCMFDGLDESTGLGGNLEEMQACVTHLRKPRITYHTAIGAAIWSASLIGKVSQLRSP